MAEVQKDDLSGQREDTVYFVLLVQMFAQQTMMQLGKIAHPVTHKSEVDLEGAGVTIGILEMLEAKTQNNLSADEARLLKNVLTDLRLNYVEEVQRVQSASKKEAPPTPSAPAAAQSSTESHTTPPAEDSKVKFHKKYDS
jgi:hypothetical protein